ncbi:DNA helicase RecQ [Sulfurovum sp. bin170]|uniref:DNA helicase RecQ n=1 Tax=Sulfurovum sp. bin170 TaxID=2695268 RepID=UPI0013E07445|nr:DNA helicase RecQ [Sulfurovum sp. bin170]NEW59985.1 DNA helicase RecQ [Sulfurovum sp. bin170]
MKKLEILQHYFGHQNFREQQEEVIDYILNNQDVLMILPTGGGKSLCYQLPSLLMSGVTVVVSPLLALMHDQVVALRGNGISASMLSSMQTQEETKEIEQALYNNQIKLLYVAPERLMNDYFLTFLMELNINFFVIDEAHCVSEWGHEFREHYRMLSQLKTSFPSTTIAAFTATATTIVREDIVSNLQLINPKIVTGSLFRKNLTMTAQHRQSDGRVQLINFLKEQKSLTGIVYAFSRKQTESVAKYLERQGYKAKAFHAGLPTNIKKKVYSEFVSDEIDIVVATIAFGMGIDKSNIRFVVHMNLPKTLENYYQEIGRAGRDGLDATTLLLFSAQDIVQQKSFIDALPDSPYKVNAYEKINTISRFSDSESCRHQQIAHYFNDSIEACGDRCDNCINPDRNSIDITTEARKLLSTIYRTKQSFGIHYVVDVIRGSKEQRILTNGHDQLSVYGIGENYSKPQWLSISDKLLELGAVGIGDYKVYYLTERGVNILKGGEEVSIREERLMVKKAKAKKKITYFDDYKVEIFDKLRVLRKEIATTSKVPPYVVFSDKTLKELSNVMPTNKAEMLEVHGVGEVKFERYGEAFLQLIAEIAHV